GCHRRNTMSDTFLKDFAFCLVLCLVQVVVALPWVATLDRRVLTALRRPKPLLGLVGICILLAAGAAIALPANPDTLVNWGRWYTAFLHLNLAGDFFVLFFLVLLKLWPKGGAFVVISASTSISDEIEGRTAVTLMSKPVSRRQFLVGKFVGILMAGLVLVVILGWFTVWMFIFKDAYDPKIGQEKTPDPAWVQRAASRVTRVLGTETEVAPYHLPRGIGL